MEGLGYSTLIMDIKLYMCGERGVTYWMMGCLEGWNPGIEVKPAQTLSEGNGAISFSLCSLCLYSCLTCKNRRTFVLGQVYFWGVCVPQIESWHLFLLSLLTASLHVTPGQVAFSVSKDCRMYSLFSSLSPSAPPSLFCFL